jgi:NAD(P)H-dependent FMN reductase
VRVVAVLGSLQRSSANRRLLDAVRVAAPATLDVEVWDGIGRLPHFTPDVADELVSPAVSRIPKRDRERRRRCCRDT